MRKKILFALASLLVTLCVHAQITTPSPSPLGSVYAKVGLTDVTVTYNRPKVRGREIFGNHKDVVVPFGKLWRTGAGDGTFLSLSTAVTIDGVEVTPGKYLILTIPDEKEWTFILYKDLMIDGANLTPNYKEEDAVLVTKVSPFKLDLPVQSLSFQISDISEDNKNATIEFNWNTTGFKLPVKVDFDSTVMEQIAADDFNEPISYIKAARYYLEYDKDLSQALKWVTTYLQREGHNDDFWYMYLQAQILAKMGKKEEAISVAKRTIQLASKSKRGDLGYIKRSEAIINSFK